MKTFLLLFSIVIQLQAVAKQSPTTLVNGVKDERHPIYALTHAHIYVDAETEYNDAVLLIQNNSVIDVGTDVVVPKNAIITDLHGANIYPGFILLDSTYGLSPLPKKAPFSFFGKEIMDTTLKGAVNANEAIKASYQAVKDYHSDEKEAKELRKNGFSTVLSSKHDGIMRGTSVLLSLNGENDQQSILKTQAAFHLSFNKGSSKQMYPVSLMGSSALIRQTWLDAQWYGNGKADYTDLDLQAINDNTKTLKIFNTTNWQQTLLANKISKEFKQNIVIRSQGDEYKHLDAIKNINRSFIVPLDFPKGLEVSDDLDAWDVSLNKMMEWEDAPYNVYYLHQNKINFAIAPSKKGQKTFFKDLKKTVENGLPKSAALAALTSTPAQLLGNKKLGNLNPGSFANFIVSQGDLFENDTQISENWVAGKRFEIHPLDKIQSGVYQLDVQGKKYAIEIINKAGKLKIKNTDKESKLKYKASITNNFGKIVIQDGKASSQLLGMVDINSMSSIKGQKPQWSLARVSDIEKKDQKKDKTKEKAPSIAKPYSAYGLHKADSGDSYLITHSTVWTNENEGVLKDTDVLIKNGKITEIGTGIKARGVKTIDGTGMHLSAGIIDEHSHIALLSVNDIAVNSSMVRMEDSLDSDSVNIYRNLAGGVTAAQLLHGSANPLGGQSALIKMRWGATSDELLIKGADHFIKFALGENVKRSRSQNSIRYPLTRMGVEQVYRDAFSNALAYEKEWNAYNKLSKRNKKNATAPRRDLMMDATLEIINKERFITCHSYVQSEINMLMKVADDYDFKVNTFTHILEGYKVADKMLAHGAGASTFSDWWSYKWEVNFAIPYNASIMSKVGITTAINSDDAEMSRRLNQEAAKSVKYGDLSEEQALKLVTLNPAKLLHLDKRMGSIKVGKDADVVLWTNNPLSIYAKANKTFVDGKLLFDRSRQAEIETQIANEKTRLVKKMQASKEPKIPPMKTPARLMQCDSLTGYEYLLGAAQ
jgi:imidazolonepropionase-like amidohydrolase